MTLGLIFTAKAAKSAKFAKGRFFCLGPRWFCAATAALGAV
jgi:hypothetical protein